MANIKATETKHNHHVHLTSEELHALRWIAQQGVHREKDGRWYVSGVEAYPWTAIADHVVASLGSKGLVGKPTDRLPDVVRSDGAGGVYLGGDDDGDGFHPLRRRLHVSPLGILTLTNISRGVRRPRAGGASPRRRGAPPAQSDRPTPRRRQTRPVQSHRPEPRRRRSQAVQSSR